MSELLRCKDMKEPIEWDHCRTCFRSFPRSADGSKECFERHLTYGTCKRIWKCCKSGCGRVFQWKSMTPKQHVCSHVWCRSCKDYESLKHCRDECYIKKEKLKNSSEKYLFIDIECCQDDVIDKFTNVHRSNLIVSKDWNGTETIHYTAREFCDWLLQTRKGYTVIAHNGGCYDFPILYLYLIGNVKTSYFPIYNGARLMSLTIGKGVNAIRLIDSFNWLPCALSKLPKTLGLPIHIEKGFFPHGFNTKKNTKYVGRLPARKNFYPERMDMATRKQFFQWHRETRSGTDVAHRNFKCKWDLQKELVKYCRNDVNLLRTACIKFRKIFLDCTHQECDPFQYTTIAGTCLSIYLSQHMQENTIANLPYFTRVPHWSS